MCSISGLRKVAQYEAITGRDSVGEACNAERSTLNVYCSTPTSSSLIRYCRCRWRTTNSTSTRTKANSNRKLLAHLQRHALWPAGLRINRTPERPSFRKQLAIASSQNFGEAFERKPGCFAHPGAQHDVIVQTGRCFVIDLVPQHHPADILLRFCVGHRSPMRSSNLLHPPQVDRVVHMLLLIDVVRQNHDGHFKRGRGHSALRGAEFTRRSTPREYCSHRPAAGAGSALLRSAMRRPAGPWLQHRGFVTPARFRWKS